MQGQNKPMQHVVSTSHKPCFHSGSTAEFGWDTCPGRWDSGVTLGPAGELGLYVGVFTSGLSLGSLIGSGSGAAARVVWGGLKSAGLLTCSWLGEKGRGESVDI